MKFKVGSDSGLTCTVTSHDGNSVYVKNQSGTLLRFPDITELRSYRINGDDTWSVYLDGDDVIISNDAGDIVLTKRDAAAVATAIDLLMKGGDA